MATKNGTKRHDVPLDMMQWGGHIASVVFLPKMYSPNLIVKTLEQKKEILQHNWPVVFKIVKVMKDKEGRQTIPDRRTSKIPDK